MRDSAVGEFRLSRRRKALPIAVAVIVCALGLAGQIGAGIGYGMLLVSTMLLAGGLCAFALLLFAPGFASAAAAGAGRWLLVLGGWMYVFGVSALAGYYSLEAVAGRVELHWILFGPAALLALVIFDVGLYRSILKKNTPAWRRYRQFIRPDNIDAGAMRQTFVSDVVLHTALASVSGLRWLRHTLILWGFGLMFAVEIVAVFVREGLPAFGMPDVWALPVHPVRLAFDFAFDFFGTMILIGCLLAYLWRVTVKDETERKFADSPSLLFLFFVVLSGFAVEGIRILAEGFPAGSGYSFTGYVFAFVLPGSADFLSAAYKPLWYVHVFGSLAFIAYVPVRRLVHSCATPVGRMMNSQTQMLAEKRIGSLQGLMHGKASSTQKVRD